MQKIISIDEYLYEISEKDWLIFQNMIQSAGYNDSEKFNEAL